jgi:hypothetical protein
MKQVPSASGGFSLTRRVVATRSSTHFNDAHNSVIAVKIGILGAVGGRKLTEANTIEGAMRGRRCPNALQHSP